MKTGLVLDDVASVALGNAAAIPVRLICVFHTYLWPGKQRSQGGAAAEPPALIYS